MSDHLKKLGKLKLAQPRDSLRSHRFNMFRGLNRKTLRQVPASHSSFVPKSLTTFIRGLDTISKTVEMAKKAPSGIWRISKRQVIDIAKKYKFNLPNDDKPMKHLGSTGIQLIRYKPGVFYLYKPHRKKYKRRVKHSYRMGQGPLLKGIYDT